MFHSSHTTHFAHVTLGNMPVPVLMLGVRSGDLTPDAMQTAERASAAALRTHVEVGARQRVSPPRPLIALLVALAVLPAVPTSAARGHAIAAADLGANQRLDARDQRRARELRALYHGTGGWNRWAIRSVKVRRGTVTIRTALYRKPSNAGPFTGVCTTAMTGQWVSMIQVYGRDGRRHASWYRGDDGCGTNGLGS
jgi:hypothetical protein